MTTRTITGTILDQVGSPISGAGVSFVMNDGVYLLDPDETYMAGGVTAVTNASGVFSVELASGLPITWSVRLPGGDSFVIAVPTGATTTLEELRAQYNGHAPERVPGAPPTVTDFTNMQHPHTSAATGGLLPNMVRVFNVTDVAYGAVGDGVTDDSAAFQDTIDAAANAGGGVVWVPSGATYKLNTVLSVTTNNIAIELGPGAVLDFTGLANGETAISVAGTEGSFTNLASNATAGDTSIVVTDATGIVADAWLRVRSDALYDPETTFIPCGEVVRVASIVGTTVTLHTPLADSYSTADVGRVCVLDMVEGFSLRGGTIHGPSATLTGRSGLYLGRCLAPVIEGVKIDHFTPHNCNIDTCIQPRVTNCEIVDAVQSLGYGIAFTNATQDAIAHSNIFRGMRHALSTNNGTTTGGIVRRVLFYGNTIYDWFGIGGIDSHTAAEDIHVINNLMYGGGSIGINMESRNPVVRGNLIDRPGNAGISVAHGGPRTSTPIVEDNTVRYPQGVGIIVQGDSVTITTGINREASVSRNRVYGATSDAIRVISGGGVSHNLYVRVDDNIAVGCTPSTATIYVTYLKKGSVSRNIVAESAGIGIRLRNCLDTPVIGNVVELPSGSSASCIYIESTTASAASGLIINDNRGTAITPVASIGLRIDNNAVNLTIGNDNDFRGNTTEISAGSGTGHRNWPASALETAVFQYNMYEGGGVLATGIKPGNIRIPFAHRIVRATLLADQSGSAVLDIWRDTYANYPPTVADTITASAKPTISAATKAEDGTLTGWGVDGTADTIYRFNLDSCTSITDLTLALKVERR